MLAAQVEIWADTTCEFPILRSAVFGVSNAGPDERNSAFPVLPLLDFSITEIPAWAVLSYPQVQEVVNPESTAAAGGALLTRTKDTRTRSSVALPS